MNNYLVWATYGWLALIGALHFIVDVVSHAARGKHPPGPETTLYYGLNSAFSLGQVAFGLLGTLIAWRAPSVASQTPVLALTFTVSLGWWAITFLFMTYREPKVNVGILCALALAALMTR